MDEHLLLSHNHFPSVWLVNQPSRFRCSDMFQLSGSPVGFLVVAKLEQLAGQVGAKMMSTMDGVYCYKVGDLNMDVSQGRGSQPWREFIAGQSWMIWGVPSEKDPYL